MYLIEAYLILSSFFFCAFLIHLKKEKQLESLWSFVAAIISSLVVAPFWPVFILNKIIHFIIEVIKQK